MVPEKKRVPGRNGFERGFRIDDLIGRRPERWGAFGGDSFSCGSSSVLGLPASACAPETPQRVSCQPEESLSVDEGGRSLGEGEALQAGAVLEEEACGGEAELVLGHRHDEVLDFGSRLGLPGDR